MATITGTAGADTLFASSAADSISGGGGSDFLVGVPVSGIGSSFAYSNDTIAAGAGNVTIIAGGASTITTSGPGTAQIILGFAATTAANSSVTLGTGTSIVLAVTGNNTIQGSGGGIDLVLGGAGNDSIRAGFNDVVLFQAGTGTQVLDATDAFAAILVGGSGADTLLGSSRNASTLNAGSGAAVISGGAGNDLITVAARTVSADGGGGTNTLVIGEATTVFTSIDLSKANVNATALPTVLKNFTRVDASQTANAITLTAGGASGATSAVSLVGGSGADTITGGQGNDTVQMGTGNSVWNDSGGNDSVALGSGNDTINFSGNDGSQFVNLANTNVTTGSGRATLQLTNTSGGTLVVNEADVARLRGISSFEFSGTDISRINFTDAMLNAILPTGTSAIGIIADDGAANVLSFAGVTAAHAVTITFNPGGSFNPGAGIVNAGSNITVTLAGGTVLNGTTSNDNLVSGSGNDFFTFNNISGTTLQSSDTISGGAGTDTLDVSSGAAVNFSTALLGNATGIDVIQYENTSGNTITGAQGFISSLTDSGTLTVRSAVVGASQLNVLGTNGSPSAVVISQQSSNRLTVAIGDSGGGSFTLATARTGGSYSVTGGSGGDSIVGGATVHTITGGGGPDSITGSNNVNQVTVSGSGVTVNESGNAVSVTATAADGTDVFIGGGGTSVLNIANSGTGVTWQGFPTVNINNANGVAFVGTISSASMLNGGISTATVTATASVASTYSVSINGSTMTTGASLKLDGSAITGVNGETLVGGNGADTLLGATAATAAESLNGGGGADSIQGPPKAQATINGAAGADTIELVNNHTGDGAGHGDVILLGSGGSGDFGDTISHFQSAAYVVANVGTGADTIGLRMTLANGTGSIDGTGGTPLTAGLVAISFSAQNQTRVMTNFVAIDFQAAALTTGANTGSFTPEAAAAAILNAGESVTGLAANATVLLMLHDTAGDTALFLDKVTVANTIAQSDLTLIATITNNTTNSLALATEIT